jgi:RHS repeat-associated protein
VLYRGKLAATEEPTGSTTHEYDARGRITNTIVTIDGNSYASGSRFDNLDREALHIYPDGSSIRIHRNPRGQLSGYGDNAVQFDFDGDGLQTRMQFNTGVAQIYGYDDDRRLTELTVAAADNTTIEHLKWDFDSAGNIGSLSDLRTDLPRAEDRSETYTYDNLYRLRSAKGTWGKTAWTYSPSGNLTSRTSTVAAQNTKTIEYGKHAGPHAMTGLDARVIKYDALGRMLTDGDRAYTWNSADQLAEVTAGNGASVQSRFDADGIRRVRVEKAADGAIDTVHFISPWSEVRNGKLVRYIVNAERRIARLSEKNGTSSSASVAEDDGDAEPPIWLRLLAQLGQLALTLTLIASLAWTQRRRLGRAFAIVAPATFLLVLAGCGRGIGPQPAAPLEHGTVRTLSADDTLLINDQLGSLLAETNGLGADPARFAAYPYGAKRFEGSKETRQYANAPRDRGVGLDLMGARFYAPDLGVWTISDPLLINGPEKAVSAEFATANPYAYSNLNPVIAVDNDGNFWHIIAGAVIGAVVGGGVEAARQYIAHGKVEDWGRVGASALGGGVSGIIQTALPGVGTAAVMGSGALSGAAGGVAERLAASGGKSAGTLGDALVDAGVGALSAGLLKGGGAVVKRVLAGPARAPATQVVEKVAVAAEKDFVNLASPQRTTHILAGDATGGGHLWPASPGKTAFPSSWSPEKIMHEASDIATDPALNWIQKSGKPGSFFTNKGTPARFVVFGEREGIEVKVVLEPAGEGIISAYPVGGVR